MRHPFLEEDRQTYLPKENGARQAVPDFPFVPVPAGGMAIWANNTIYYRHPEWLGSSRLTSDQNHNIYSDSAYSPFGEVYAQAGLSDESFTGMDQSTVTNMYDFPARELAIVQSNWLSPDPAGLASVDPSDPQTWNRYAYVRNSPLTETDPTGMGGFVNGQPTCIWNSCQTRQIEDQAELNYQNEESIYGYGGYNEFDTLSFALAPTCQNDCRVFYGNLDALGLVGLPGMSGLENPQNLLPPPQRTPPSPVTACEQENLSAVNNQFGTGLATSDVEGEFQYSHGAPTGQGTLNLNISVPLQYQSAGISPGRYPVNWWTYLIGYGATLHIPSGPGGLDSSLTLFFSGSQFTEHLDSAFPYNPIGFLIHLFEDVLGLGGRNACPR